MFKKALILMLVLEAVSLFSFVWPAVSLPALILVGVGVFVAAYWRAELGIFILFGELFIGSRGRLLEYGFISLRMVVFFAVFLAWILVVILELKNRVSDKEIANPDFFSRFKIIPWQYWFLALVILAGVVNGYFQGGGVGDIFFDANGYLYFAILPLAIFIVKTTGNVKSIFMELLGAAVVVIALKTLILYIWFGYGWPGVAIAYHWVVEMSIGEITGLVGSASRIFMQSQFYSLVAVFIFGMLVLGRRLGTTRDDGLLRINLQNNILYLIYASALLAVLMSLSRSFWFGLFAASGFLIFILLAGFRTDYIKILKLGLLTIFILLSQLGLLYFLSLSGGQSISETVVSRAQRPSDEAAGSARLFLLPELMEEIKTAPLLGKGFGRVVGYDSYLPDRISAENPTGRIESYAFEWGYLDIILKTGLLGFLAILLFIAHIFKLGWKKVRLKSLGTFKTEGIFMVLGLLSGLVALAVLNVTTPYLNHPLGIGYLILCFLIFQYE